MSFAGQVLSKIAHRGPFARALRHRNYKLFFFGQGTSLIGTWMQRIALGWLVYRLTESGWLLGVVGFSSQIFTFAVTPFAGVLADRANRHHLVIATQTLAMCQAFLLAALTLTGKITVWEIIALSAGLGLVNSIDIPVRQSFVVEMVEDREDLPNAIALNSFMVNGARLVGPSVAGILIAAVGEAWCFLLNGVSFMAVIAALLAMRVKRGARAPRGSRVLHNLQEGFKYAFGFEPIRAILLQLAMISLLGTSYQVLLPVFAKDILQGGPKTLGFLQAAAGVGAIAGAITLASRTSVRGLGRVVATAAFLFGAALIGFSFSRTMWLSAVLLIGAGFGMMIQMASCNTLLQTIVDDDKRGRVMSFYTMAFMGMGPFGSLLAGALSTRFGAPGAVIIGGAGCILAAAFFARRLPKLGRLVHPIYVRIGIARETSQANPAEAVPAGRPQDMRL
jgi:MFS family permease